LFALELPAPTWPFNNESEVFVLRSVIVVSTIFLN
jgi:hypothetical protein